jgi:hypothetical protein
MDAYQHGFGKFTWPDGSVYNGLWKNGDESGYGEINDQGEVMAGVWGAGQQLEGLI